MISNQDYVTLGVWTYNFESWLIMDGQKFSHKCDLSWCTLWMAFCMFSVGCEVRLLAACCLRQIEANSRVIKALIGKGDGGGSTRVNFA
jgi:hypothetical protein